MNVFGRFGKQLRISCIKRKISSDNHKNVDNKLTDTTNTKTNLSSLTKESQDFYNGVLRYVLTSSTICGFVDILYFNYKLDNPRHYWSHKQTDNRRESPFLHGFLYTMRGVMLGPILLPLYTLMGFLQ